MVRMQAVVHMGQEEYRMGALDQMVLPLVPQRQAAPQAEVVEAQQQRAALALVGPVRSD